MFANRFTALVDACSLAGTLRRNLLLSLAEAEFFRIRWSTQIMEETEKAIGEILMGKGVEDAAERAKRARNAMERAFAEATVDDFAGLLCVCEGLPDAKDAHVVAAAVKCQAATIVTENLKDFPSDKLRPLNLEARSADAFLADTIDLELGRAVAAIRRMRERFKRPDKSAEQLLLDMEAEGLVATVDVLRPHVLSL